MELEDSALDDGGREEGESLWRYFLKRTLSYSYKCSKEGDKCVHQNDWAVQSGHRGGALEVEFSDLTRIHEGPSGRLSLIVAMCEKLSDNEYHPLSARMVHLKGHDSICVSFEGAIGALVLLLFVRGQHHDLSQLHGQQQQLPLTLDLTETMCFGCIPVDEYVWWYAHVVNAETKVSVHTWQSGCLTVGEKHDWDGYQDSRHDKVLRIQTCQMQTEHVPYHLSFRIASNGSNPRQDHRPLPSNLHPVGSSETTSNEVAFRFVYGSGHQRCVQQRTMNFGCPFCSLKCQELIGLRYHLAASHDLFHYQIEMGSQTVMWVRRRMEVFTERGEIFCPLTRQLMHSGDKAFHMNRMAFLKEKPMTKRRRMNTVHSNSYLEDFDVSLNTKRRTAVSSKPSTSRIPPRTVVLRPRVSTTDLSDRLWRFHHSKTAMPMTSTEVREGIDTDEDEDANQWEIKSKLELESIKGVSITCKDFMFIWDSFIRNHIWPYSDIKVPTACVLFAWKLHDRLTDAALKHHFLSHLHALYTFKLIQQEDIDTCVELLTDRHRRKQLENKIKGMETQLGRSKIVERQEKIENALAAYKHP